MKNQKLTIDIEKIERKAQEREKQLDKAFRISESEFKLKNENLTEKLEKKVVQIENLNKVVTDTQAAVSRLSQQSLNLSLQIEELLEQNHKLED